tara:strand:+ start:4642 stop:5886 length:1245 start_codon:yes stop_codon:yes gene_type:complete
MKKTRHYREYEDYLNHQKTKTLDPVRRKKWLNEEWELKIKGFGRLFDRHGTVVQPEIKVLCIGARTGQEVVALKNRNIDAIGIDIVPHPPHVIHGDMHNLDFPDDSFDFVFSNVFDHALYPDKKISEIERVLKTDGHALLQFQIDIHPDQYTEVIVNRIEHDILPLFKESFCIVNNKIPRNFAGMNYEILMKKDSKAVSLHEKVGDVTDLSVPDEYQKIWNDINLPIQTNKGRTHNIQGKELDECLNKLSKRAYYLVSIAEHFGAKNIVEVGTAQGWQFYSFAHYAQKNGGKVYSCDIKDVRNEQYKSKYLDSAVFSLGDSKSLANKLKEANTKIDMFYIDGSHQAKAILMDILNLRDYQSENCVWVFDDYDVRFGCYKEIGMLQQLNNNFKVYRVGDAASGNPNHQVMIAGKL